MDKKHIHFIGIAGMGMSAIARIMLERGYTISGSDLRSTELTENLQKMGATIYLGHSSEHLDGADIVVYSSAVPGTTLKSGERRRPILNCCTGPMPCPDNKRVYGAGCRRSPRQDYNNVNAGPYFGCLRFGSHCYGWSL